MLLRATLADRPRPGGPGNGMPPRVGRGCRVADLRRPPQCVRRLPAIWLALALLAPQPEAADCSGVSVGAVPLVDLGAGSYLGFEGGLYPGGSSLLPASHAVAADSHARVSLLDPAGAPDAIDGKAVLLSIGMSNTTQEFSTFIQAAGALPGRNQAIRIVDGAQGGWAAARVADPGVNAAFWDTIDQRLAAADVTPLQVQAVWLKEAEASPTDPFPLHAERLRDNLRKIVRIIQDRFPNTRQIFHSSRTYAGYASTNLNPEMFAYESGFAVKWLIEHQLSGSPSLNFDPSAGPVESAWMAFGPYLWADGLSPRSDGLVWECTDFSATDGTHPSASGRGKVAALLLDFFSTDAIAARWFMDCAPSDPGVFAVPMRALDLRLVAAAGGLQLRWEDLRPSSGAATVHDVVTGSLEDLHATGGFSDAACAATQVAAASLEDPVPEPLPGSGVWYLVRGRNSCGTGTFSEPAALQPPREALDASSPCP
ncbi:MAG TPA: hypothetical protein VFP98_07950 [Candidatus Polarisedimenticolia bacterium]|nr:hypothetical protein [Candidatus Polarisedimenticolia bacterium]